MKRPENMSLEELRDLAESVEGLIARRREEADTEKTPEPHPHARFPRIDGEREWLEAQKMRCGKEACKKGCREGKPSHGPYWKLYVPKENGPGVTSRHIGRELPSTVAANFDLPGGLDASAAHRYGREAKRNRRLVAEAEARKDSEETAAARG